MFGSKRPVDFREAREKMVRDQLAARRIEDPRVLEAMAEIPRHRFVPLDLRARAYDDNPLPIGWDQTISQPYIVARMSELLALRGGERVLEIGAGCGYQTAILSRLARTVCALELEGDLARQARETLDRLGIQNVDFRQGDGFEPWPGGGEFEAILCACAPREIPQVLVDQLAPGGTLVVPTGPLGGTQELRCVCRGADGEVVTRNAGAVRFVPMRRPRSLS